MRREVITPRTRNAEREMAKACGAAMLLLILVAWLSACSPATRIAGRCPTLPTLAVDFTIATVGLGASVARFGVGHPAETPILFSSAMLVALAANLSECR